MIDGLQLIKRVITVDGQTLGRSGNALVRLGTSVRFVLNAYKLNPERQQRIILGGPFMGFTLPSIDVPLTKSATCIFVPAQKELPPAEEPMNCIRCGRCARVCPSRLVPYQLYALSKAGKHKKTKACGQMDCTECGCCAYVCPSRIPLSHQFRKEKAIIRLLDEQQWRNQHAQERIAARNERLKQEEAERQKRRAAALARAKQQKEDEGKLTPEQIAEKRAAAVAAARARAAAKREAAQGTAQDKAHNMMGTQSKDGMLVAAMMAQGGTSAMLKEQAPNAAPSEEELSQQRREQIPYALRLGAKPKHAQEITQWPEIAPHEKDLSRVENPPAEGVIIPESKPKTKSYLYAPEEKKDQHLELPTRLRRADASDSAQADRNPADTTAQSDH